MIIEVHEVPDGALDALLEAAPDANLTDEQWRAGWKQALAAALTAWEAGRDPIRLTYAAASPHECIWRSLAVQHRDMMLVGTQTDVTMKCDGCGDLTSRTLNGTVTLEQVRG